MLNSILELHELRAKTAELENRLQDEMREGILLEIVDTDTVFDFEGGDIVVIVEAPFDDEFELYVRDIFDEERREWVSLSSVRPVTRAEARATIMQNVDKLLNEFLEAGE